MTQPLTHMESGVLIMVGMAIGAVVAAYSLHYMALPWWLDVAILLAGATFFAASALQIQGLPGTRVIGSALALSFLGMAIFRATKR